VKAMAMCVWGLVGWMAAGRCQPNVPSPSQPDGATAIDASPPVPIPPAAIDAAPLPVADAAASLCAQACAALAAAGCSEGLPVDCPEVMSKLDSQRLMRAPDGSPITCSRISGVRTQADALSAGVSCTPAAGK
jgi:hypothetical protein